MTERMTASELHAMQRGAGKMAETDGPRAPTRAKRIDVEGPIHKAILEWLVYVLPPGTPIHHSPNELNLAGDPKAKVIAQAKAKALGMVPGWPDIEFMADGRAYFLEVKPPGGAVSEAQMLCHTALQVAGCKVMVVKGIDGARRALEEWGLI